MPSHKGIQLNMPETSERRMEPEAAVAMHPNTRLVARSVVVMVAM